MEVYHSKSKEVGHTPGRERPNQEIGAMMPTDDSSFLWKHGKKGHAASLCKEVTVVKCQECPMVCLDMDVLRVHKFLHQDLTYLQCPACSLVFGPPSQLKRHVFLQHN